MPADENKRRELRVHCVINRRVTEHVIPDRQLLERRQGGSDQRKSERRRVTALTDVHELVACEIFAYFLRWRILARMRRFLRPLLRRPLPVFLVPKTDSCLHRDGVVRHMSDLRILQCTHSSHV